MAYAKFPSILHNWSSLGCHTHLPISVGLAARYLGFSFQQSRGNLMRFLHSVKDPENLVRNARSLDKRDSNILLEKVSPFVGSILLVFGDLI